MHISETEVNNDDTPISCIREKRCQAYEASILEIEPYSKKPKIAALSTSSSKEICSRKLPESLKNARNLDLL